MNAPLPPQRRKRRDDLRWMIARLRRLQSVEHPTDRQFRRIKQLRREIIMAWVGRCREFSAIAKHTAASLEEFSEAMGRVTQAISGVREGGYVADAPIRRFTPGGIISKGSVLTREAVDRIGAGTLERLNRLDANGVEYCVRLGPPLFEEPAHAEPRR